MRNVPRISIDEVKALMAKKQVVLIDVRDPQSFADGHMPGAINVPFDFIPNHVERGRRTSGCSSPTVLEWTKPRAPVRRST